MPRTLPWTAGGSSKAESKQATPLVAKQSHPGHDNDEETSGLDVNSNVLSPSPRRQRKSNRTPSTSPPPAPPDVEYMHDGLEGDDIYMMVEDEFLSTAKLFTQHIHHAEYVRLKQSARSRGKGTLQAIERAPARHKREYDWQKRKRELAIARDDEATDDEDDYMLDPQLAGLMTGGKDSSTKLKSITKQKSNTRAAAGFSQSPHNVERKRDALMEAAKSVKLSSRMSESHNLSREESCSSDEFDLDALPRRQPKSLGKASQKHSIGVDDRARHDTSWEDDQITSVDRGREDATLGRPSDYLAKRRANKERRHRDEIRKGKRRADEVPTFLF